ncbi:hypothetical protein A3D05_01245 [Candidatus Gottesmanbacteria bacterium RIFCSPHIGHO2_02_FULL_40_24]|uniref:ABC transporter permease n=1 Tax=Candidatus Gottesmanbacteria bacterium RIFCSPHIGHO2_01_FULL_40_15 TaxID=1798376 RepID=A0A1F5Z5R0_9BACT|nr:MAG: hypothetical protein A2777_02625 [Candidatus Gottesmanbacteria bacterium RIFCSPHIGHO2_01_FULL_40_15]OGG18358.1 MAG: hypothetical protein A3D05_01245 [Candidatus Gottesmanbacteria bacterium RIFCSPHIGHO2_02_FULL_40_24]OGG21359.1 MAG: hypothetical protein A3B48_02540 [Candidatus Gottesmanbacteria bacterium RIFCSPLOWO2_01_FULL_40_10]OGG25965.1 MAG: hypothetical protein A3E42_02200 [Candidatus Gottesmanbacteria bacterium RIFCSPHIGHO2_12_FULL_40_13]
MRAFTYLLKQCIEDFRRNLLRTFLTSLGILIGVSSIILLIAVGLGLKEFINNQFESLGSNILIVLPGSIFQEGGLQAGQNIGGVQFDEEDYRRLKKMEGIEYIAPAFIKTVTITGEGVSETGDLYATTEEIFPMRNLTLLTGGYFTAGDITKRSKKAILGPKIAEKLFGKSEYALHKSVKIENLNFKVIGILESKGGGGLGGPDFDSFVYVPYKTAWSINKAKDFYAITVKATDIKFLPQLKQNIKDVLLKKYEENDFSVAEQEEIQSAVSVIFSVINLVLIAIAGISLIVGGIGIMNIMYVSVFERFHEIGIRRAVGATKKNILSQFLLESVILSLTGGILGLLLSFLITLIVSRYFPVKINIIAISVSLISSAAIGIIFGVIPAKTASNLSPVEAIRYE